MPKFSKTFKMRLYLDTFIKTPEIGEILMEEFLKPMGLSIEKLAQEIHLPVSDVQDIIHNKKKITADTSLRLGKLFGVSERYFLDMQSDIDIRNIKLSIAHEIDAISRFNVESA